MKRRQIDFKLKTVVKDKRHYILMKRSIHQEYVIVISIYTNNRAQKYMKQKWTELKGEIDDSIIITGPFNTPLSIMARITRQKVNKEIEDLDNTINH